MQECIKKARSPVRKKNNKRRIMWLNIPSMFNHVQRTQSWQIINEMMTWAMH